MLIDTLTTGTSPLIGGRGCAILYEYSQEDVHLNLVAIFYHKSQDIPVIIHISDVSKFPELCESLPTTWAYLYNKHTGEVLDTYKHNKHSEKTN